MNIDEFWVAYSDVVGIVLFDTSHPVEEDGHTCYLWLVNRQAPQRFNVDIARDHFAAYEVGAEGLEDLRVRLAPHVEGFRGWRATYEEVRVASPSVLPSILEETTDVDETSEAPRSLPQQPFSVVEDEYLGNPVLEVLINGHAWESPWDAHFCFGLTKARMILTVRDLIELFWLSGGERPRHEEPVLIARPTFDCVCACTTHAAFENSYGQRVFEKYIHIKSGEVEIGFGLRKAEALLHLEPAILAFIRRYGQ